MNTPGPHCGQNSALRVSFPSSETEYLDHLALAFGPSPITGHLQILQQYLLNQSEIVRDACE